MLCTILSSFRRMCCFTRNSQTRAHRSGVAASFPLPFGRTSNHHSSVSDSLCILEERPTSCFTCAREGARACLFFLLFFCAVEFVAVFCWLSAGVSSFKCFCVSSRRSRSVLKKSASVVTKDSALMVTVLTCFPSAAFYSRVFLMASLKIVTGFCCTPAFLIVGKPRLFLLFVSLSGSLLGLRGGISFRP